MKQSEKSIIERAKVAVQNRDKISAQEAKEILDDLNDILASGGGSKWWVIVLKVLAYAIGLILAGFGTTAAAATLHII